VQGVESIVVGQHNVCIVVQQQRQHVISLLRDGIVQGRVAFRVLSTSRTQVRIMQSHCLMDGYLGQTSTAAHSARASDNNRRISKAKILRRFI
jgi:hypothetical protein